MELQPLNRKIIKVEKKPEKILQFGEGNFLRAFVNWCVDTMNKKGLLNAGVVVVQPISNGMVPVLNEQEGLYTLYLNGIKKGEPVSEHQIINCINRGIDPYTNYTSYLKTAENPEMQWVFSNTTEAGIAFKGEQPKDGETPDSFPGKLTAWLHHRFTFFKGDESKGVTIIPCELINHNGHALKECILKYASLWKLKPDFSNWVENACIFCNTLVDRIVPGYPREKAAELCKDLGYEDKLLVEGEQFHLWVIEGPQEVKDKFPADIAGLNVIFTDNQAPYRSRKVRILNGAHTTMVPIGLLYGVETVKDVMDDALLFSFIRNTIFDEIIPTLDLEEKELENFAEDVLDRFRNPYIKHMLLSISLNSHSKYLTRIFPSVEAFVERKGELPNKLVFGLAALIQLFRDVDGKLEGQLKDNPEVLEAYQQLKPEKDHEKIVETVFAIESIWGGKLSTLDGLKSKTVHYLNAIDSKGVKACLSEII